MAIEHEVAWLLSCGLMHRSVQYLLILSKIVSLFSGVSLTKADISKFADDKKTGRPIKNIEDARRLQEDLNRLQDWSEKWKMQSNVNKCTIMSVGKENWPVEYTLSNNSLRRDM